MHSPQTGPTLILIDIQNDYFPGGRMELTGSGDAGNQASRLLAAFRAASLPIVHIQHVATRPGSTFFLPDTEGARIHDSVTPLAGEAVIIKHAPNSFHQTTLLPHLRDLHLTELVIAGMMTHMCVDTTVRAAADLGFTCTLAHDACATRPLSFHGTEVTAVNVQTAFLAALHGSFADVTTVDAICAKLLTA